MKILTWNVERLKKGADVLAACIKGYNADIVILTETGKALNLESEYNHVHTTVLNGLHDGYEYRNEIRTSIWTKYNVIQKHVIYDCATSICADVETEIGLLTLYGTIIGIDGGKGDNFKKGLDSFIADIATLNKDKLMCLAGDFNIMLSGYAYPSHEAGNKLKQLFNKTDVVCLTAEIDMNVNHIAVSNVLIKGKTITVEIWNEDKKLSDHKGICVTIE